MSITQLCDSLIVSLFDKSGLALLFAKKTKEFKIPDSGNTLQLFEF